MIEGLNHITIAVSNVERSLNFYTSILDFKGIIKWNDGAYLTLNQLWLCISKDKPCAKIDYSHVAFSVARKNFDNYRNRLEEAKIEQWMINKSEGNSLYFLDPDGYKLEEHVGDLESRLLSLKKPSYKGLKCL